MRYRLPDVLGGMVLPEDTGGILDIQHGDEVWLLRFDIPGVGVVRVQREALVEVAPPLPPEPPDWTVVGIRQSSGNYLVLQRQPVITVEDSAWFIAGDHKCERHDWAEVCAFGPPVLLVPDPLTDAPALPWYGAPASSTRRLTVKKASTSDAVAQVEVGESFVAVNAETARQFGLALLRAASEREAKN